VEGEEGGGEDASGGFSRLNNTRLFKHGRT
jgi:hypothetical protein